MQKKYYIYCSEKEKREIYIKKLKKYFIFTSSKLQEATDILCIGSVSREERKRLILSGKTMHYIDTDLLPVSMEKSLQDYL